MTVSRGGEPHDAVSSSQDGLIQRFLSSKFIRVRTIEDDEIVLAWTLAESASVKSR